MKAAKGFSLVEVLIALLVVTMGSIYIHRGFSQCLNAVQRTDETLQTSFLIQKTSVDLVLNEKLLLAKSDAEPMFQEGYQVILAPSDYKIDSLSLSLFSIKINTPKNLQTSTQMLVPNSD